MTYPPTLTVPPVQCWSFRAGTGYISECTRLPVHSSHPCWFPLLPSPSLLELLLTGPSSHKDHWAGAGSPRATPTQCSNERPLHFIDVGGYGMDETVSSQLWWCALFVLQVMGVVGPSSVADGLPLLHLSPYLSPPLPFSTAVVRLVALQIQVCLPWPVARQVLASGWDTNSSVLCFLSAKAGQKLWNIHQKSKRSNM